MKFNKGISTLAIIFIVIIGIVLLGLLSIVGRRIILKRGISSYESAYKEKEEELCSNSQYSTEVSLKYGMILERKVAIALDEESKEKLKESIEKQDNSALNKITDLTCLEALLIDAPVSDVSSLPKLNNLEYLSLELKEGTNISPLSNLDNLTLLYLNDSQITGLSSLSKLDDLEYLDLEQTEVSKQKCKSLKEKLSGVEVKCSK